MIVVCVHSLFLNKQILMHLFLISCCSGTYPCNGGRKLQKAPKCPHHCLKLVELVGFSAQTTDVDYVRYLIESAVELEKIMIDPRCQISIDRHGSMMR
jgi:hypothetical protein